MTTISPANFGNVSSSAKTAFCIRSFEYSENEAWLLYMVTGCFIPAVICCFGAASNFANAVVLHDKRLTNHTYTYLAFLAVVQFFTALTQCLFMSGLALFSYHPLIAAMSVYVLWPVFSYGTTLSLVTTVVYTVERYLFVGNLEVGKTASMEANEQAKRRSRWVCAAVASLVLALNMPRMLFFEIGQSPTNQRPCITYRWNSKTEQWFFIYTMTRFLVYNLGSIVVLLIFNALLISLLCRQSHFMKKRNESNKGNLSGGQEVESGGLLRAISRKRSKSRQMSTYRAERYQRALTSTVICSTFLTLVCEIYVSLFNPITEYYTWGKFATMDESIKHHIRNSTFSAIACEYSGAIVVYYFLNKKFRKILIARFCAKKGAVNSSDSNNTSEN